MGDPVPTVTVRAASEATIQFRTQNGEKVDGVPPETWDLPHLVLYRNSALAAPRDRTLLVEVTGIEVPPAGVTVTLVIESQHGDPDLDMRSPPRIRVWREARRITNTTGITQAGVTVVFSHEFTKTVLAGGEVIATPTDYFRYDLVVTDAQHPATRPRHNFSRDYAFLMENQWIAPLPEVREASAGATPDELIVFYCDMFPFRKANRIPSTWLPREQVPRYVGTELVPAMSEAFRIQTDVWGFPWYGEWSSYRPSGDVRRLSVALTDGRTWFHGKAPAKGNAQISINVSWGRVGYDTLTDGLMSTFHHELFHNHQRNIYQRHGGSGWVAGAEQAWQFFTEGMAVLASSVGQPTVQFSQTWGLRAYAFNARGFMGTEKISQGDLNKSYERMSGYHAAAYWRFLYEQCGGMSNGAEDPAAGMRVIRQALHVLYAGDIVDISASTELVGRMPEIMDQVLGGSYCPFKTHRQSLLAFASAMYALRLEGMRCTAPGLPQGCGFFDPHGLYTDPPHSIIPYAGEEVTYTAANQPYPVGIRSSFGMDFVDVVLDPRTDGSSLVIALKGAPNAESEFTVQIWPLNDPRDGSRPRPSVPQASDAVSTTADADSHPILHIPAIDTDEFNRLGLLIIRTDIKESLDPNGAYTLTLHSGR